MLRRDFLTLGLLIGWVTLGAAVPRGFASERIRILGDGRGGPSPTIRSGELRDFVRSLSVGEPVQRGDIAVVPILHARPHDRFHVLTLDEALGRGLLTITERGGGTVPELIVENRAKEMVLLLAGEILVGGKQNRVLSQDILLPPQSGPLNVGVYCVEQGRWDAGRGRFESKGTVSTPSLRAKALDRASQAEIWGEVGKSARSLAAESPSGDYQRVYEKPEVKGRVDAIEGGFKGALPADAVGAAIYIGARFGGMDLFVNRDIFAKEWEKLLRAAVVEGLGVRDGGQIDLALARKEVMARLDGMATAPGATWKGVGLGETFEFRVAGLRGAALVHDGRVIHAALLDAAR